MRERPRATHCLCARVVLPPSRPRHPPPTADATVASAEGLQWVQARGYTLNATAGYVFPAAAATAALGPA